MCVTHASRMPRQKRQKLEFLRRKLELGASARCSMPDRIDLEITDPQYRNFCLTLHPMAQRSAHTRQQLADIERLIDIVVGTKIECLDLFSFAIARGQDDNRKIRPFSRPPDDVLAVAIRQPKIEQHDVRRFGGNAFDAFGRPSPALVNS